MTLLSPAETPDLSIWQLARRERAPIGRWLFLGLIAATAWFGAVAYLGQVRPGDVSRLLRLIGPLDVVYWSSVGVAVAATVLMLGLRNRAGAYAAATVLAFILGMRLFGVFEDFHDTRFAFPFRGIEDAGAFSIARLQWGAAVALPLLAAWLIFGRKFQPLRLGFGDWRIAARDFSRKDRPQPWGRMLITGYLIFIAITFVALQASVGFAPIRSGALWPLIPAILLAALVNATVEEIVFRGFMQPAFIAFGGAGPGLWIQGVMFGLMHWGVSVGVLAALPVSLGIGLGSVIWGKAAYETGGLSWVIIAHALIDICVMAAVFVPG